MHLLDDPIKLRKPSKIISSYYYKLLDKNTDPSGFQTISKGFEFSSGHSPGKKKMDRRTRDKKKEIDNYHNQIQTKVYSVLTEMYGKRNVGTENHLGNQERVDVIVQKKKGFTFYEIKTSSTAKAAIREALGQIMAYAFWPDKNIADKLVIVSTIKPKRETRIYMERLRNEFKLPIYYQHFDDEKGVLMEEI